MRKTALTLTLAALILTTAIVAGVLLVNPADEKAVASNFYVYPISVGGKNFTVTVETNWTSEPKVYLPEVDSKYFCVDFIGARDNAPAFFNVTYPDDLIWGKFSLVWKYYEQSEDRYTLSGNGTHHFVYMTFNHWSTVEHFEIRGTEGAW